MAVVFAPFDAAASRRPAPPPPCGPSGPRRTAATAVAQAPVPQARVTPTPRSHTRMRMRSAVQHLSEFDIDAVGKQRQGFDLRAQLRRRAPFRHRARTARNGDCPSRRRWPACALPSSVQREIAGVASPRPAGSRCQSSRGSPISTVTRPLPASLQISRPPLVASLTRARPRSSISRRATQRVALPQLSTSPPSALKKRRLASASAPPGRDHHHRVAADAEMAVGDAPCACAGVSATARVARVEHDEIIAQAVHFQEGGHGGPYMGSTAAFAIDSRRAKISNPAPPICGTCHARDIAACLPCCSVPSLPQEPLPCRRSDRRSLCLAGRCAWRKSRWPGWRSRTRRRWRR